MMEFGSCTRVFSFNFKSVRRQAFPQMKYLLQIFIIFLNKYSSSQSEYKWGMNSKSLPVSPEKAINKIAECNPNHSAKVRFPAGKARNQKKNQKIFVLYF